jgi:hypothetical protein
MNTSTAHVAAAISRALAASLHEPQPTAFGARQRTTAAKKRSRKAWPSLALTVSTLTDGTAYVSWTLGPAVEEGREVLGGCFESAVYTRWTGEWF